MRVFSTFTSVVKTIHFSLAPTIMKRGIKLFQRKFLSKTDHKIEENVTKYLDLMLKILSTIGLFELSEANHVQIWRKIYIGFTFTFCGTIIVLCYCCVLLRSSKDTVDLFEALMETVGISFVFIEIILLNMKRKELLDLLHRMNTFDVTSNRANRNIFTTSRKVERLIFLIFCGFLLFLPGLLLVSPFLPVSPEQLEHVKEIYELENPRNRLPYCMWVPGIDTSKPVWFTIFYLLELYAGVYWVSLGIMEALFIPCILLHLSGQYLVLSNKLRSLGKSSFHPTMHIDLGNSHHRRMKKTQDIIETRHCIIMHQKLVDFRSLVSYSFA